MSGKAHRLHRVEVIEVAPVFLEAVRRRQSLGIIAQMVLAELAGVVAEEPIKKHFCKGSAEHAQPEVGGSSPRPRGVFSL